MAWTNTEIARQLGEIAELLRLDDADAYRVRAYERAAGAVGAASEDLGQLSKSELTDVHGIGSSTADKIIEFQQHGEIGLLAELRARVSPGLVAMTRVPGLGPKLARRLHDELGLDSLDDLAAALDDGRVASLDGMGEKSAAKLAHALERIGAKDTDRTPVADVLDFVAELCRRLGDLEAVERVDIAGSLRRLRETVGDVDVLVATDDPAAVSASLRDDAELVAEVLAEGDTKLSIITRGPGVQVDVRLVPADSWGAALLYFTGSKAHTVRIRERAVRRGLTVNEYGIDERESGKRVAGTTEEEAYAALALPWIPPTMREDTGEIEAADEGTLPRVVEEADLQGDLHAHSDVSGDGKASLETMVKAAAERGLRWWAVTDHAENLTMNGATRDELLARRERLGPLGDKYGITLLDGLELNIDAQGGVDYDDDFLATFDWCVASIHSMLDRDSAQQTERICQAMTNPHVHTIGHPTGRQIGRRPGYELDWERVFETAVATGTALEINGSARRLDIAGDIVRRAIDAGITLTIGSDAHSVGDLDNLRWAVKTAQRGWATVGDVLNCRDLDGVRGFVRAKREDGPGG